MGSFSSVLAMGHTALEISVLENFSNTTLSLRVSQTVPVTLPEHAGLGQWCN